MTMDGIALRFKVTLHVDHPELNPDTITTTLGLKPSFQSRKGETKRAPNGAIRPGMNVSSHWSHRFDLTGVRDLFAYLDELLVSWEPHRDFFNRIADSGGTSVLFCGIIADGNWDEQMPHFMAARLASLKIDLRLDAWMQREPTPAVASAEKPLGA